MVEHRLKALVRAVVRSRGRGGEAESDTDPETRRELVEVDSWGARMQGHGLLDRLLTTRGPDRVTRVGETVHLHAPTDRVARLRASRWRVRVGDQVVMEQPLRSTDDGVVVHRPLTAGRFEVRTEFLDDAGAPIGTTADHVLLQVIDAQPCIAVDVELVRTRGSAIPLLHELRAEGSELFYFDLDERDRTVELRRELAQLGAPAAAIVAQARDTAEMKTLGVDFRAVFFTVTLRRMLGAGLRLVAVVSGNEVASVAAGRAGVASFGELNPARRASSSPSMPADEPRTPTLRLDRMTRTQAIDGNACDVELDNRRARQRLFAAIDAARSSIHLQFYMVRDGAFSDRLGARLIRAARRGVRVRVLVDALYSVDGVAGATNAVARGLVAEPGIEVVASKPIESRGDLDALRLKQRDHRKVVVIDGHVAFVGGRNAADEYYTGFDEIAITDWTPHSRIPWLDAHIEVCGPLVGSITRAFMARWVEAGGRKPSAADAAIVDPMAKGGCRARLILHEGVDDAAAMLAYEALIDGASEHLWVVNDFPIVPSLQFALRRALQRGVRVRLLTGCAIPRRADGTFFDGPLHREAFEYMTKKRLEPLMREGAEVWEYVVPPHPLIVCRGGTVRPYVHAKLVTADGRFVSLGSANLDATASYWEREANVIVEDTKLAQHVEAQLAQICDRGRRVDPRSEQWRKEGLFRDLASQLWPEALYS